MELYSLQSLVTLNNVGAALLQSNCFDEAYVTFIDALYVSERYASISDEDNDPTASRLSLEATVACAMIRLDGSACHEFARDTPAPFARSLSGVVHEPNNSIVCPIESRERKITIQTPISLNRQFVRPVQTYKDIVTAVIIYNFALCHLKMSMINARERQYLQESGIDLMKKSYDMLPSFSLLTDFDDFASIYVMTNVTLSFLLDIGDLSALEKQFFLNKLWMAKDRLFALGSICTTGAPAA